MKTCPGCSKPIVTNRISYKTEVVEKCAYCGSVIASLTSSIAEPISPITIAPQNTYVVGTRTTVSERDVMTAFLTADPMIDPFISGLSVRSEDWLIDIVNGDT